MKNIIKRVISKLNSENSKVAFPNGHYYSPIVNIEEVENKKNEIWKNVNFDGIVGIDLNSNYQKELVVEFEKYYSEIPFKASKDGELRYYFENDFYSYCDGINLFCILRHFSPNQVIEVGSGYTSALMLDTNNLFFENKISLTFIEPYTDRLDSLLKENDKTSTAIIRKPVQEVPVSVFENLKAGDILFIDSTHVSKTGSDVNYLFFEVLPKLAKGVIIHFHDIYYPFEYPIDTIKKGISWNEDYLLRAFLTYNKSFEIILFSDYMIKHHNEAYKNLPLVYKNSGANIWLRKVE